MHLLLTRPRAQIDDWAGRMAALGVPTLSLPLIEIEPAGSAVEIAAAWRDLSGTRLAMFVSPNAVTHFFAARPPGLPWPGGTLAATVGPGSARELLAHGVPVDLLVQPPEASASLDSEHLWPELRRVAGADWSGRRALLVRGDGGREWLGDRLREAGAEVAALAVYRRRCPRLDDDGRALLARALRAPREHIWLFSSSEAVGHLETLTARMASTDPAITPACGARVSPASGTPPEGVQAAPAGGAPDWSRALALATHERIAQRAQALGVGRVVLVRPAAAAVAEGFRVLSGSTLESSP